MLYSRWEDLHEWLESYHICAISEAVNSMVKFRFGAAARGNELNHGKRLRCGSELVRHNIRRGEYLEIMGDVVLHCRRCA
ncbi:MAG: hypothetical protein U9Q68_09155 [Euryarchaeota archaeon]|nr:hypothetical protein [Euryarchaeota archaeon]